LAGYGPKFGHGAPFTLFNHGTIPLGHIGTHSKIFWLPKVFGYGNNMQMYRVLPPLCTLVHPLGGAGLLLFNDNGDMM